MKLIDALEIVRKEQFSGAKKLQVSLICGFNPLHFQTFLAAELCLGLPNQHAEIATGLYGDFWGSLKTAEKSRSDFGVVVMEWSDLDPRLGLRNLGSWAPSKFQDIVTNVKSHIAQFLTGVERVARDFPVVISFPTLPLPAIAFSPSWQANSLDLELCANLSQLVLELSRTPNVRIVSAQAIDRLSPVAQRSDARSELISGFPYKLPHASIIAKLIATLIQNRSPKKGLITDLDDTVWSGILGEVGSSGVSWDLANHSHMHGAYQRLLHALAESGVLIAVASKNEERLVEEALQRTDLVFPREILFPIEAHWQPKSQSVMRILKTWNIGPDSVVFVDDSPMELAEVKASHPEVDCILFPTSDPPAIYDLFRQLRDLFGKSSISEEDTIRRDSIRNSSIFIKPNRGDAETPTEFLDQAEAEISFNSCKEPLDPRALELVNKTNQFNLNGERHNEAEWQSYVSRADTVIMVITYRDKYGPLGKIAVMAGRVKDDAFFLDTWVMSCRAFGRRIEQRSIERLFEVTKAATIVFRFKATGKNGPLRGFLAGLLGMAPGEECALSRREFDERRAMNSQRLIEASNG
jgi:FkbH-like protein